MKKIELNDLSIAELYAILEINDYPMSYFDWVKLKKILIKIIEENFYKKSGDDE